MVLYPRFTLFLTMYIFIPTNAQWYHGHSSCFQTGFMILHCIFRNRQQIYFETKIYFTRHELRHISHNTVVLSTLSRVTRGRRFAGLGWAKHINTSLVEATRPFMYKQ